MSDTKSYMNNDNIITETVLEKLFKWLVRNPALKKDKKIPLSRLKAAAKKGGKLGKRANLALTFRKMRKG